MKKIFTLISLFILLLSISTANAQKKKLTPKDYGQWQRIRNTSLSPNGNWFAYTIDLVDNDEDGWLVIKKVDGGSNDEHKFMFGMNADFTENSKWAAFLIGVSEKKQKKLKKQEKRVEFNLALMNLSTAAVDTFGYIQDFTFSPGSKHLVMEKYKPEKSKSKSRDIILRNLETRTNQLIGNVAEYGFNDAGTMLAVLLGSDEKTGNGVQLYNLKNNTIKVLDSDSTEYIHLTWHPKKPALAFLKARTDTSYKNATYQIYAFKNLDEGGDKYEFDQRNSNAFPDSLRIVDYRSLQWSNDANTVFFGVKKWEKKDTNPDTTLTAVEEELKDLPATNVSIWHWKDARIQPNQKLSYKRDLEKNYLSAWHIDSEQFVQIGNKKYENISLIDDEEHAIAYDSTPYEPTFEESWQDVYLINVSDGSAKQILKKFERVRTSPGGQYVYYFKENNWWTYNIATGQTVNLTVGINTPFQRFRAVNGRKWQRAFGQGQWGENDKWLLIYGEYDVYKVTPDGKKVTRLTNGAPQNIQYRQLRLDREEDFLKNNQPIYFSIYGDSTKNHGFARYTDGSIHELIYEPKLINRLDKAKSADNFVYMVQGAADSPDIFYTDTSFDNAQAITHTNPQQEKFYWADDSLITFTNEFGQRLQGRLIYPANYEPGKKYPMITYIYEERSQSMHQYSLPGIKSAYNYRRYSSEGYFVFQPDITYKLHDPGMSAVKSVVPAVKEMIATGMIDTDRIGLIGHSWGAYQTTFIITQTDIFKAAIAGAPLTNMISMYNSIYWNSGGTDGNIFEISQGRFPEPWWKDWDNFVENSTIFNMQGVTTPLLVFFGTDDGAVDFNQGVELYTTMRRMGNPFVMLVYEGANHHPSREENQIDYATRAFQWFQYYLLGQESADWIKEGLPYIERPEIKKELKEGKIKLN